MQERETPGEGEKGEGMSEDAIFISYDKVLTDHSWEVLKRQVTETLPGVKVIILEDGMKAQRMEKPMSRRDHYICTVLSAMLTRETPYDGIEEDAIYIADFTLNMADNP